MQYSISNLLSIASVAAATAVSITPHDAYSSSVGVLGCKIDVNRVAYWPMWPDCNKLCVKVTANGRSVNLLQIDTSGGAHDISYDAWNYLSTGQNATVHPTAGGGFDAEYEWVDNKECADLIHTPDGKLPLSAANSMNWFAGCPAGSYVRDNSALWNILNPSACTFGFNEECKTPDLAIGENQATCPHPLGSNDPLHGVPVVNIQYPSGALVDALQ